jgi:hypothetical protein
MDNFLPDLTFTMVLIVGLMVIRLRTEIKEIKKLLDEVLESSRRFDKNP